MIKKHIFQTLLKLRGLYSGNQYNEIKIMNSENIFNVQAKYLEKLLIHAHHHIPYYSNVLKKTEILENEEMIFDRFSNIPLLTKQIIKRYEDKLISKDYISKNQYWNSTGGSTGEPLRFMQDDLYRKWGRATLRYYYEDIIGIDELNAKKVLLWGSERDTFKGTIGLKANIINRLTNTVLLNSFRMTEKDMERYARIINSYKPDLIRGYAGSIYEFCNFVERKRLPIHSPKIVVGAAETLHSEMRAKIESVFGTKIYNFYGSREVGAMAGECKYGLIHLFQFNNYVEIVNNHNKEVGENQEGKIIVTNLHNYSMPFIRYEIGDMAILGPKKCGCGCQLPTLKKITGRVIEHFIRKDGTVIPGEFFIHLIGVVCNKGFISKFQIIQEDYEKLRLFIVLDGTIDERSKREIRDKIRVVMGDNCKIIWEFVDEIPKTKSGKYLYTKSLVNRT